MTTDAEAEALSPADKAALERAIELYRAGSRMQRTTIDALFARGDSWEDVARYAAFHMQMENLHLPPWLVPPCNVRDIARDLVRTDDDRAERTGLRAAAQLLQRMQRCGVSRWHPNPVAACEAAAAEQRRDAG
jgi:hypothetical protein